MEHTDAQLAHPSADNSEITVYWRPGCPFCSSLRRGLHRAGLPFREVNIWDDPN
ncbi:MAG: glutaredoxin domain-containing protein, partial [Ilumatobacteraceae bacterium]